MSDGVLEFAGSWTETTEVSAQRLYSKHRLTGKMVPRTPLQDKLYVLAELFCQCHVEVNDNDRAIGTEGDVSDSEIQVFV
ncbi:hypothetical protein NEOLEDRAFT_1134200 [Neolentinus lepideus HHB14362 ss-1]|uniref:Uncharacterized protein n=1 Tax=Neolentinus lepideus HHB14362 ss-1 TaxID=1314782 RepID=A0A165SD64_9AGAM|nr:hypothetical protein NEOLEDRAFT_1134200 [Neolentinus lepideus HHB14362 ss-1]